MGDPETEEGGAVPSPWPGWESGVLVAWGAPGLMYRWAPALETLPVLRHKNSALPPTGTVTRAESRKVPKPSLVALGNFNFILFFET